MLLELINKIFLKEIGETPIQTMPLTGGDINQVYHCILKNHQLVIKLNTTKKYPKMFEKEKQGLDLLSKSMFRTPKAISYGTFESYDYLIL